MEQNNLCAQYCVDVIRAVMQEQTVPVMPEQISLAELYAFSKLHSVETLVFLGISQLEIDMTSLVWQDWENRVQMLLTQSVVQLSERDVLFTRLTEAGMDLLPVKGCWLKELYPQIDFRQMSDLDLLIHEKDRKLAGKLMQELGYREDRDDEGGFHHDAYVKKPYMAVELHFQLLPPENEHCDYYSDIWDKACPVEGFSCLKRLQPEDEYIYYLLHMKEHLDGAGCGIRLVLDSVVYRNVYPNMDRRYLKQECRSLGIWDYLQQVETIADCWFRTGNGIPDNLCPMAERILQAGTYGLLENCVQQRMEELKTRYKNPLILQIVYWSSRLFRPRAEMEHHFPILKKLPILLPICWIARIMKKCVQKPKELLYHVREIYRGTKHG